MLGAVVACTADFACLSCLQPSGSSLQALPIWYGGAEAVFRWDSVRVGEEGTCEYSSGFYAFSVGFGNFEWSRDRGWFQEVSWHIGGNVVEFSIVGESVGEGGGIFVEVVAVDGGLIVAIVVDVDGVIVAVVVGSGGVVGVGDGVVVVVVGEDAVVGGGGGGGVGCCRDDGQHRVV